jgi:hypothetical protein
VSDAVPIRDMATRHAYVLPRNTPCVSAAVLDRYDDARPDALRVLAFYAATGIVTYLFAHGRGYAEERRTLGATTLGALAPGALAYVRSSDHDAAGCEQWWLSRIGQAT